MKMFDSFKLPKCEPVHIEEYKIKAMSQLDRQYNPTFRWGFVQEPRPVATGNFNIDMLTSLKLDSNIPDPIHYTNVCKYCGCKLGTQLKCQQCGAHS